MKSRLTTDQGMRWIRHERRLAIYIRDGLACVYCNTTVQDGATLTLDHLQPSSHGGPNDPTNLVTACSVCNARRYNGPWKSFASPEAIRKIEALRLLPTKAAKAILKRTILLQRGFSDAIAAAFAARSSK